MYDRHIACMSTADMQGVSLTATPIMKGPFRRLCCRGDGGMVVPLSAPNAACLGDSSLLKSRSVL